MSTGVGRWSDEVFYDPLRERERKEEGVESKKQKYKRPAPHPPIIIT
jgi:hypothetical protein